MMWVMSNGYSPGNRRICILDGKKPAKAAHIRAAFAGFFFTRIDPLGRSEFFEQPAQQFVENAVEFVGYPLVACLEE